MGLNHVTAVCLAALGVCLVVMSTIEGSEGVRKPRGRSVSVYREKERVDQDGSCHLEINCKSDDVNLSMPVKLPIKSSRGPQGLTGERGDRGQDGLPGQPGIP